MVRRPGYVYIMASGRNGTIYIGVTSNLARRAWEHREGVLEGFTKDYGCKLLVWYLAFDDIQDARAHELRMKKWNRAWKLRAIEENNPLWHDLYPTLAP
jgi:putative endonuclease